MTYEIIKHIGVLSEGVDANNNPMKKEVNLISWNRQPPVVDIRSWSDDHEVMTHGATFTKDEFQALANCIKTYSADR